jgi:type II secretory pathway pseudopilin PulG
MMSPRAANSRRFTAFTLIEVIVAVTLLGAGLVLTCEVLHWTSLLRRENERRQCAMQEAANALERIRGWSWQELVAEQPPELALSESALRQLPQGDLQLEIAADPDDSDARRIAVEVSWQLRDGQPAAPVRLIAWRSNVAEKSP